ncbi:MAG TPA: hypothetical protein VHD38_01385 [Candidatus Paceibacterota bacterium]|jgi:hypothetical protein|nr:hypothetical protein [Candidatus Paceibacterota bacterium]
MKRFLLSFGLSFALAVAFLPSATFAAPAACTGAAATSQDATTKVWTCDFQTPNPLGGVDVSRKYFNDDGSVATVNGVSQTNVGAQGGSTSYDKNGQSLATCDFLRGYSFSGCIWQPLMSALGAIFLTIGGATLRLVGTLFDSLTYRVIIDFKGTLDYMSVTPAISTGWTIFRDFSNILIIGIFVFIAISIILGLEEFGQKKLIARVLIVAILINFSLLFTKVIIDASNFTAYQVYKQMAGTGGVANFDIAQRFLVPMGITSLFDTKSVTDKVAKDPQGGAVQAFFFGLVGGIMLIAVAIVLAYGCFLIMARGVLFIFLMLTAALAFATYLIPSLEHGEFGWSSWWKSLFNSAIFAPLLMLFLFVSLTIISAAGQQLSQVSGAASAGAAIDNPQTLVNGSNWTIILLYMLGTGLLFVSFKMSSKFAGKLSGITLATGALATPFALATRGVAPALRNTFGRSAYGRAMKAEDEFKRQRALAVDSGDYSKALKALEAKSKADKAAKRTYEALDTKVGQAIGKSVNVPESILKKVNANYADSVKSAATHAAQDASKLAVSKTDASEMAKKQVDEARDAEHQTLKLQHQQAEEMHNAAQALSKAAQSAENLPSKRADAEATVAKAIEQKLKISEEHASGKSGTSIEERDRQLREQDERIKGAQKEIGTVTGRMKEIDALHSVPALKSNLDTAQKALRDFHSTAEADTKKLAENIIKSSKDVAENAAAHIADHHKPLFAKLTDDNNFAAAARKTTSGRIKNSSEFEKRKRQKEFDKEIEGK